MRSIPKWMFQSAIAMAASGLVGLAAAQGYPSKPIRFVITYPSGGGSDYTRGRSRRSCRSAGASPSMWTAGPAAAP